MNKLRFFSLMLCLLVLTAGLCGCKKSQKSYTAKEVFDAVTPLCIEKDNVVSLSNDQIDNYFSVKSESYNNAYAAVSRLEESNTVVAVFAPTDETGRDNVLKGIGSYLKSATASNKAAETTKKETVTSQLIYGTDNLIIFVICDDISPVKEKLGEFGAKPVG